MNNFALDKQFDLDKRLEKDTFSIADLSLSRLLLMNDQQYPWLILVPRVVNVQEVYQLSTEQQQTLYTEITKISELSKQLFNPFKLNIAALGNIVSQLHIHVIARQQNDKAWPNPVWGAYSPQAYLEEQKENLVKQIQSTLKLNGLISK